MKQLKRLGLLVLVVIAIGFLVPENLHIPVQGAASNDWNHQTFWAEPWGKSGVHKGIDIFASKGTPAIAAVSGLVIYQDSLGIGGNVILIIGPKWRLHYYAHLQDASVERWKWVEAGDQIGTVGDTGNAVGKPPHLHYSILSLVPYFWQVDGSSQGWKKVFFLNPSELLLNRS